MLNNLVKKLNIRCDEKLGLLEILRVFNKPEHKIYVNANKATVRDEICRRYQQIVLNIFINTYHCVKFYYQHDKIYKKKEEIM